MTELWTTWLDGEDGQYISDEAEKQLEGGRGILRQLYSVEDTDDLEPALDWYYGLPGGRMVKMKLSAQAIIADLKCLPDCGDFNFDDAIYCLYLAELERKGDVL